MNYNKGFIGRLILILVAIFFILSYFNIDIKSIVESPSAKKNWVYVSEIGKKAWNGYLEEPTQYLWNTIFASYIKESFTQNLKNLQALREGKTENVNFLPQGFIPVINVNTGGSASN
ncbi:MAG: hypothetical protein AAB488_02590 [Patescibacteria group bacterium]